ncbi:hypothetical protein DTO027I6_4302 [Penicillium roqueforti]|uniref:uncharacterized protein n=1 Tax=Penicillium roqueforti TaxID=5082 RepID=UPI0019099F11|nr:uncharacterized protein LCP9604111_4239 [Penicillium roqueforti]KAF9249610.1 hypothetical protein LCP9604111_4239 [Penicillium roqueforti]KAI2677164.1 hypothetical protein CBS147355_5391 [Penicillium roqueforti]KAI2688538.1 hypothetical protein LCP963914a_2940 [Penicillium roqueforti]KAI2720116.1 hypothetical protein CBS147318_3422 [Penicillium roqueforti]KAI3127904.1 hypothetical protein CBS147326_7085 [Penicillium roqueforti]
MFAKAKGILDKSSSIRDEVNEGNYHAAKDIVTKGETTKESTSQGNKANEIVDKSSSARDEVNQGNSNGAKEVLTQGQNSKESSGRGAVGGASISAAGMNNEDLNKGNVQETGKQGRKGRVGQDNTGTSTGETKVEQRDIGSEKQEVGQEQHVSIITNEDTGSKQHGHRDNVAAGELEPNDDIRKGPITMPGTFQEKDFHNANGKETIVQRGTTSEEIPDNFSYDSAGAGSQKMTGLAVAGGESRKEPIDKEVHDNENISSDVLNDGTTSKDLPKKLVDENVGKYHIDKKQLDKQGSQPSEKAGTSEVAATDAAGGGYGMSKGAVKQTYTTRKQSKGHSGSSTNAATAQGPISASSKSNVASTVGEHGRASGKGAAASNQTNSGGYTYARAVSNQGLTPKTPTSTGNSTTNESNQTSGLRSTTTSQTNNAFYNAGATGSNKAGIVGGGVLGLHQEGNYGISGNDNSGVNQGSIAAGGGTRQGGVYNTSGNDSFSNRVTHASSGTKSRAGNGVSSKRIVTQLSGCGYKLTILQEKVQAVSQKCKTQLGLFPSEISKRSPNVDAFFDAVAAERLRWMPHDGSRLDCSLRWASRLAYAVDALRESVGVFAPAANEAATLIWGFSVLLLESDMDNTDVFESVFGRYGRVAVGIYLLLQYEIAYKSSPELQPYVAAVFADLLEMVSSTAMSCVEGFKSKESDQIIGRNVDAAFLTYAKRFSTHWNCVVDAHTAKLVEDSPLIYSSPELGSLRQFLGVQDRPLQFILDSRAHSLAEGSFEWFNNMLYDFSVGSSPVMLISGGPGSGKSALAQWAVERLQESGEHDSWNVIPYTIRADIPVATLPLRILKGVLHQMLDHSVSDKQTQEAILVEVARAAQGAIDGAGDDAVEASLWKGIHAGLATNIQYMFVVDGIDQIRGGHTNAIACLDRFCEILSEQNAGSKMIAFTRPLSSKTDSKGIQQFSMQTSQTKSDLIAYVDKMLASSANFDTHKGNQLHAAVSAIVARSQGSFSWAEMAVAYAKQQKTLSQAVASIQGLPQSMPELIDFHSKSLDLSQQGTISVVSWLAAAERPLLVEEIEHLLNVDPKGPRYSSNQPSSSYDILNALSPLVMTRDGVVSFSHTCIRDHIINQAKSSGGESQLSIKDAHYDLLTRCLSCVQLSVREEVDISMDRLGIEERNHLFDKYVVLEYTARYWLSHLLSSPIVTDDEEFQFNSRFKKLMPATVLFARLELTCRESQFTRSSVVELYRLASDIRRLVLGEKSIALLQSLILSARVSKMAHASHADETCYKAWKLSQELLGQSHPITMACSEMMIQSFSEQGTIASQQEDILKSLILTDSEITGVEFNQRLKYLGMIVSMYKTHDDNQSALFISKHFYQQVLQKYGTNSHQSSETADFLTSQFSTTGSDEVSRDIARTKYDNMVRTMEVTDERRISYTLHMAKMYEDQGELALAQAVLSSLWAGLNSRDIDSVDMMDKKSNVALVYYQFLRRQGRSDESEVIIRELVADLEVTGIHSEEMMQRVHLLRAETREMLMYNLDRSLSILMWRYYKETHQEYSEESTALALSIAQSMANAVSIEDASSLSSRDRKLLIELLDVISASPDNMTVTTLILCHNLASIYVSEGDWTQASECSMAVLRHIWPTIEQSKSHQKFSPELAPPAADLALVLAYCHFRRLHLEHAAVIYENAVGSLISSAGVPVASVLAVAKAAVEFHETTYQFNKALNLLHTISNYLAARLGEKHEHTINNMYLEAALATRLEKNSEAKSIYQRIFKATSHQVTIVPEGIAAAIALISLYDKEMQWDSALHVYRALWPTLVVEDNKADSYDHALVDRMLEKTYLGYMSILTNKSSNFSERYRVASEYVMTCRHLHGATSEKTLNATLLLAELCESSDAHVDQAISLYKLPLETSEWVAPSQSSKGLDQMTSSLPITLKHKLAQLFVRKHDSTIEARSLYTEEFQLAKKNQGYFSTTTLSWLRELALAHSRQGTSSSVQQGNAILHAYSTDVLHADGDTDTVGDWARRIASIYLECGFIEGGNNLLDELRHRVVYSLESSSAVDLSDRRDAVFVAAFEEVFGRRASYDQIMSEMAREMKTSRDFSKSLSGHDFIPTLIIGHKLYSLQVGQKRVRAANDTKDKLYDYFCSNLSATKVADKEIVQQFYQICLREVHRENYSMKILTTSTNLVRDLCNSSRFQEATILTGVLHSFLHLTDGLNNQESINTAIQLCLYLGGHKATKCTDEKTYQAMSIKSKLLLQEIMASSKSMGIEMVDLPFNQLNDIITLLGQHEMFDELEAILTQLWTSRIVQRTWTPDVVVWIGRRLVETRFCRGNVESAIQLCRDICYNLRQVWGSCDPVTLNMTKLLSALFTASENHQSAATLHEGILYDLLSDSEAEGHANVADTASQHMELLRRAQARLGPDSKSNRASAHAELSQSVADRFGVQSEQIKNVGDANGGEQFGVWSKPRRFSIDVDDMEEEGQTHHNHLRESSGVGLSGSGTQRRISVQAL